MNPKILLAFVAGAVLASGIVYLAVKPEPVTKAPVATAPVNANAPAQPAPADAEPAETLPPSESQAAPQPKPEVKPHAAVKPRVEKRSPVARHEAAPALKEVAQVNPPTPVSQAPVVQNQPNPTPPPAPEPQPAPPVVASAPPPVAPPPAPEPPTVTLPAGTSIAIRVGETLNTQKNQSGDTFLATLSQPLVADGFVIAERGARAEGRILQAQRAGRVKGLASLTLELTKITTSDGQHIRVKTSSYRKEGDSSVGKDAAKVGGGAALGAIIGAIAGGGKGAGIGAGVGGAAGAGDVLLTRGKDAVIPVETKIIFNLQDPLTITERLR